MSFSHDRSPDSASPKPYTSHCNLHDSDPSRTHFTFIKGKPNIVIKVHGLIKIKIPFALLAVYTGMSINKKEFIENLDLVLEIFRRFKEKMADGNTTVDQAFVKNFDDIIRNYQIIREEIPDDLVSKFGMPIQIMAIQLVEQLRQGTGRSWDRILKDREMETKIDEMLRNTNLSDAGN